MEPQFDIIFVQIGLEFFINYYLSRQSNVIKDYGQ